MAGSDTKDSHGTSTNTQRSGNNTNQSSSHPSNTTSAPSTPPTLNHTGNDVNQSGGSSAASLNQQSGFGGGNGGGGQQVGSDVNQSGGNNPQTSSGGSGNNPQPSWTVSQAGAAVAAPASAAPQGVNWTVSSIDATRAPLTGSSVPTLGLASANGILTTRAGLESLATDIANEAGIPPNLFKGVISQESQWKLHAVSGAGAYGLGQLMPATAAWLGVNQYDPIQNLTGSAKYLSKLYDKYGNWNDALSAYNLGPTAYDRVLSGTRTLPKETRDYVPLVMGYVDAYGGLTPEPKNAALSAIKKAAGISGDAATQLIPQFPTPAPLKPGDIKAPVSASAVTVQTVGPDTPVSLTLALRAARDTIGKVAAFVVPGLKTRTVTTIPLDANGNPILTPAPSTADIRSGVYETGMGIGAMLAGMNDVGGSIPPMLEAARVTGASIDVGGLTKTRTVYVTPDGGERAPSTAGDVPLLPGAYPPSLYPWWHEAFGQPKELPQQLPAFDPNAGAPTSREAVLGGAYITGPSLMSAADVSSGVAMTGSALDVPDSGITTITVHGGTVSPIVSALPIAQGAIFIDQDPSNLNNSPLLLAGADIASGALPDAVNWNSVFADTGTPNSGSNSIGGGGDGFSGPVILGGSGSSIAVHHDPFDVPSLDTYDFEPQYFDLADLLNGAKGSKGSSGSLGTVAGGSSLNPVLLFALAAAGVGGYMLLRHKHG